jgi:hypothetical protein
MRIDVVDGVGVEAQIAARKAGRRSERRGDEVVHRGPCAGQQLQLAHVGQRIEPGRGLAIDLIADRFPPRRRERLAVVAALGQQDFLVLFARSPTGSNATACRWSD